MSFDSFALLRWIDVTPRLASFYRQITDLLSTMEFNVSHPKPIGSTFDPIDLVLKTLNLIEIDADDLSLKITAQRLFRLRQYLAIQSDALQKGDLAGLAEQLKVLMR